MYTTIDTATSEEEKEDKNERVGHKPNPKPLAFDDPESSNRKEQPPFKKIPSLSMPHFESSMANSLAGGDHVMIRSAWVSSTASGFLTLVIGFLLGGSNCSESHDLIVQKGCNILQNRRAI